MAINDKAVIVALLRALIDGIEGKPELREALKHLRAALEAIVGQQP